MHINIYVEVLSFPHTPIRRMVDNAGRLLSPTALTDGVLKSTCCVHPHGTPPGAGQELNLRLRGLNPASRPLSQPKELRLG